MPKTREETSDMAELERTQHELERVQSAKEERPEGLDTFIAAVSKVEIPSFWEADPVLWFRQCESAFRRANTTSSGVKYHMVWCGSVGSASACFKAGPSSILGLAPQGGLITTNVTIVNMVRCVMVLRQARSITTGHRKGWALEIETFLGLKWLRGKRVPFRPKKVWRACTATLLSGVS